MKPVRFLPLLAVLALLFTSCTTPKSEHPDVANKSTNFLGIMAVNPESYKQSTATDFSLSTDELVSRQNISGDNVSLLWGLVKLNDY